jgi:hypothetical protein
VITLALIVVAWLLVLGFVLAILTAAKLGDESMALADGAMTRPGPAGASLIEMLPDEEALGQLVGEVAIALGAERVVVMIADAGEPSTGVVAACLGTPGLVGRRVPMPTEPATGVVEDWNFAQIPLHGRVAAAGAVAVAALEPRSFTPRDLGFVEQLARSQLRRFDRRRIPRGSAVGA